MKNRPPPEVCPVCSRDVPRNAKACPECGSCYESGWNEEESAYDNADIPDYGYEDNEKFDYDAWRAREEGKARAPGELHPAWKIITLLLAIAMLVFFALRRG
jgi:hypothetical protein